METFAINRRKIAKAVFVVFFVLMGIFCIVYASFGILNLLKIKNAFEVTISQMSPKWEEGLAEFPSFNIEKGGSYSFSIQSPNDEAKKLVATYTPGETGGIGNISFKNLNGERANLNDVISLIADLKDGQNIPASYVFNNGGKSHYESTECFSTSGVNAETSLIERISFVLEDGFIMPETNDKKLGYNIIRLLTKANLKPGKTATVLVDSEEVKARKYSVLLKKDHLEDFIDKITLDGSVENTPLVREIKTSLLDMMKNCDGDNFIISTALHKGKVISVECETPAISDDIYLFSVTRNEKMENIHIKLRNVSKNQNIMKADAQCNGKHINILYMNTFPRITVNAHKENDKLKLNLSGQNRLNLNFITQIKNNSYNMEFYKDKNFSGPPFLNVYITENK